MSRGSQIAIGITVLVCALGFSLMAPTLAKESPKSLNGLLAFSLFLWVVAAACLFQRGRFVTMRITATGVALFGVLVFVFAIHQGKFLDPFAYLWAAVGIGAAVFAATGKYPRKLPLGELFAGNSSTTPDTAPGSMRITLESSSSTSVVGAAVSLTATVTPVHGKRIPTGSVTFYDITGAKPVSLGTRKLNRSGMATLLVNDLVVGAHRIQASHDSNFSLFNNGSNVVTQIVAPVSTSTTLTLSANPVIIPASPTLTVRVAQVKGSVIPTGSVVFQDVSGVTPVTLGVEPLDGRGVATLAIRNLAVGVHQLQAVYASDSYFENSSSEVLTQVVEPARTAVTLDVLQSTSTLNDPVTFTAAVTQTNGSGTPVGSVTFFDIGVASPVNLGSVAVDAAGRARLTISNLAVGTHLIQAVFTSTNYFSDSTSDALPHTVNPAFILTTVALSANPVDVLGPVTLTATVMQTKGSAIPTGSVTFLDISSTPPINLGQRNLDSSGVATLTLTSPPAANYQIRADYTSNGYFQNSSSSILRKRSDLNE